MKWYFWIALLVLDAVLVLVGLKMIRRRLFLLADKVGAAALLISVNAFFLIRTFVIDTSQCQAPTFGCLLNTNRGVWTFGAMCVAAATLYVNARMKQQEQLSEELTRRDSALRVIASAVDELIHNLQHFANEIDEHDKFISFPATSFEATYALLRNDVVSFCYPRIASRIGTLQRISNHNKAMLRSASELDLSLKTIALMDDEGVVTYSRSRLIKKLQNQEDKSDSRNSERGTLRLDSVRFDERIITHSVRGVMEIALFHPEAAEHILRRPQFRWLVSFRKEANDKGSYTYFARASELDDREAAALRARRSRLYCWIKDREIDNIEVVALRTAFRDLTHIPH